MIYGKSDSAFLAIAITIILCLILTPFWGSLAPQIPFVSLNLVNFDKVIYENNYSTVSFQLTPHHITQKLVRDVKLYANDDLIFKKEITILNEPKRIGMVIPLSQLKRGDNLITINVNGKTLFYHLEKRKGTGKKKTMIPLANTSATPPQDPYSPLKVPLLFILLFIPGMFLFKNKKTLERLALTFATGSTIFIITPWILNYGGLLNELNLTLALIGFSIFAIATNYKKVSPKEKSIEINRLILVIALGIIFTGTLMLFLPSHFNLWNVFYERYSAQMINSMSIPAYDSLSYLGRGYTFVEGYFLFSATTSWITGYASTLNFALVQLLLNAFFIIAILNFGRALNFKLKGQILLLLFLLSSVFIFVTFAMSPKHILALALLLTATAYIIEHDKYSLAGGLAAIAAYSQALMGIMYPLLYILFVKKIDWPRFLKSIAIMILVFGVLYLPIFAHSGMPYEVNESEWGYLIKADLGQALTDLGGLVAALLIVGAIITLKTWKKTTFRQKKIIIFAGLFTLIEVFVSYRVNIFLSLTLTIGFIYAVKQKFRDNWFYVAIILIALFSIYLNFQVLQWSTLDEGIVCSGTFINEVSPISARILSDPLYGHAITYLAQRPVLSDLYVEYANTEKLEDAYQFIKTGDMNILKKYKIDYVLINRSYIINEARNVINYPKPKEFLNLDKIETAKEIDVYSTNSGDYPYGARAN